MEIGILHGKTLAGLRAELVMKLHEPGGPFFSIVVHTEGHDVVGGADVVLDIPVAPGKACVALEDAIEEFRATVKITRRLEQMGSNGKRDAEPINVSYGMTLATDGEAVVGSEGDDLSDTIFSWLMQDQDQNMECEAQADELAAKIRGEE